MVGRWHNVRMGVTTGGSCQVGSHPERYVPERALNEVTSSAFSDGTGSSEEQEQFFVGTSSKHGLPVVPAYGRQARACYQEASWQLPDPVTPAPGHPSCAQNDVSHLSADSHNPFK